MKAQIALQSYTDQTDEIETANIVVDLPAFHPDHVIEALSRHFALDTIAFANDKYRVRDDRIADGRVILIEGINERDAVAYQIIAVRRES